MDMNERIPTDLGKRVGNLDELPEELRAELVVGKTDELEEALITGLKNLDDMANLDELLVMAYKLTGKVYKRQFISNKMYRMAQAGLVESVPKKKGVYSIPQQKKIWGHHEM